MGLVVTGTGYGLLAPLPLLTPWSPYIWGGAAFLGIGLAMALMPVYKQVLQCSMHETSEQRELATSGLFTISLSTGSFIGPTAGGMLAQWLGTAHTFSSVAVFMVALADV